MNVDEAAYCTLCHGYMEVVLKEKNPPLIFATFETTRSLYAWKRNILSQFLVVIHTTMNFSKNTLFIKMYFLKNA